MANSDHEDFEVSTTPPPSISDFGDAIWSEEHHQQQTAWCKTQTLREFRHRRYTVSHVAPPAPPSTPTLLTTNTSMSSNAITATDLNVTPTPATSPASSALDSTNRYNQFYYVTSSKNLHRDSRCTEAELAELFNVVTITNRLAVANVAAKSLRHSSSKHLTERGIRNASRTISKLNSATKIFKIHRNPKEFLREPDEDSVSAPEYDTEEEDRRVFWRYKSSRRLLQTRRERKFARFEHQERMETIVDSFDAAMSFNDAEA